MKLKLQLHLMLLISILFYSFAISSFGSESEQAEIKLGQANRQDTPLSLGDAQQAIKDAFIIKSNQTKQESSAEVSKKIINYKEFKMPYEFITYGKEPEGGHSLYISLHGGGGTTAKVNDRQWKNQIRLYKPEEGIYLAPRAPTNTWNLWHRDHIDSMLAILIDRFIAHHRINPNKVYILGYSAGGDGVYRLAPRMADRWAGASMMAGHPGNTKPHNLINLPYFLQCGGKDTAYNRNKQCVRWGEMLDGLTKENPGLYPHKWIIYPQYGHGMNLECKQALPWMAQYTRNPWPRKINWYQDGVLHHRSYWLSNHNPKKGDFITAEVTEQTITLSSENIEKITIRLNDALLNLDKEIIVKNLNGKLLFKGKVQRSMKVIQKSLTERLDPTSTATAKLEINL